MRALASDNATGGYSATRKLGSSASSETRGHGSVRAGGALSDILNSPKGTEKNKLYHFKSWRASASNAATKALGERSSRQDTTGSYAALTRAAKGAAKGLAESLKVTASRGADRAARQPTQPSTDAPAAREAPHASLAAGRAGRVRTAQPASAPHHTANEPSYAARAFEHASVPAALADSAERLGSLASPGTPASPQTRRGLFHASSARRLEDQLAAAARPAAPGPDALGASPAASPTGGTSADMERISLPGGGAAQPPQEPGTPTGSSPTRARRALHGYAASHHPGARLSPKGAAALPGSPSRRAPHATSPSRSASPASTHAVDSDLETEIGGCVDGSLFGGGCWTAAEELCKALVTAEHLHPPRSRSEQPTRVVYLSGLPFLVKERFLLGPPVSQMDMGDIAKEKHALKLELKGVDREFAARAGRKATKGEKESLRAWYVRYWRLKHALSRGSAAGADGPVPENVDI
ncbi:unnamed protein product [Pedinophyceae sp. YPF-701]|nr:unnamed protein product [Pedinophyceae sp. YPF-701]